MADSVELRMSVTAIKRVDPYVKEILAKSTHVALYKFNPSSNEWEKTETEGALFLYSRNGEPFHSIMIMNRLNTDNLIEPIVKDFEYQMQAPFLLFRNSKSKIFGIWFYNRDECVNLTLLLESVMESVKERTSIKPQNNDGVDIFQLLTKAQEDFNKTPVKSETQPQFSSTPRAPDIPSQRVMEFFAFAGSKHNSAAKPLYGPDQGVQYTLQRLMSNPAHSVEHIEKQQRSTTPQEQVKKGGNLERRSIPINFTENLDGNKENGGFVAQVSPPQNISPLAAFLSQIPKQAEKGNTSPLAQLLETPQKPSLMPPIMFASSSKEKDIANNKIPNVEPLTKNQMLQALSYLLKHDSDFVTKLHEAYVKSLTEIVNHNNSSLI